MERFKKFLFKNSKKERTLLVKINEGSIVYSRSFPYSQGYLDTLWCGKSLGISDYINRFEKEVKKGNIVWMKK